MKKILVFGIVQLSILTAYSQDIHKNDALILPESGTYIVSAGQTVKISSGISVTLLPGVHLESNSNVSIKISNSPIVPPPADNPAEDLNRNWVTSKIYDEDGKLISASKDFFDSNGKPLQSQVKSFSTGHVLATQPIYDLNGRVSATTLPAPINNSSFRYKDNFIQTTTGGIYTYKNFNDPTHANGALYKTNNPDPVGSGGLGSVGWYYSDNNGLESHVATTSYPYSSTDYYNDGTEQVRRTASPGDELRMGKGREPSGNTFPVVNELAFYKQVRDKFFPESISGEGIDMAGNAIQQVSIDGNGTKTVSITDLTGKVLMTAISGNENWLTVNNEVLLNNVEKKYIYSITLLPALEPDPSLPPPTPAVKTYPSSFSVVSSKTVDVYKEHVLYWSGPGYDFSKSISSSSTIPESYIVKSDFPFEIIDDTGCEDCPSRMAEPSKASSHSFQLLKPSTIAIGGSGQFELLDMKTEQAIASTGSLAPGYYKLVDKLGDISLNYTNSYSDISLTFYNQLGQVIANIAPEGVKKLIENINTYSSAATIPFVTLNEYDLKGKLVKLTETDAGTSEFIYRTDGSIRFSQNAEQKKIKIAEHKGKFSYTNYDRWGRPIESGEYVIPESSSVSFDALKTDITLLDATETSANISGLTTKSWVKTHYDLPNNSHGLSVYIQDEFSLKSGVSWTENEHSKTWYNYDTDGRVTWMVKEINGLGKKAIDYTYDARGNVTKVDFQKNTSLERFVHEYEYDADNRLKVVYTTAGSGTKKEQARYYYYLHGPLKRVELAENLQGIDYAYTPQGWLKSINHPETAKDPGKDGVNGFAPDAFGMTLEYFNGDYTRSNTNIASLATGSNKTYYNGTITAQSWRSNKPQTLVTTLGNTVNNPGMFTYEYDDKYQFNNNKYGTPSFSSNSFTEALNKSREHGLSYDANGNIKSLARTKMDGTTANSFGYNYFDKTNKLNTVTSTTDNTEYASYSYDELGQMVSQTKGTTGIYLVYDVSGKVTGIYSDSDKTQLKVSFAYDEVGMRIKKTDHVQNIITYYVYDAAGNVLALYNNNGTTLQQKEVPVYASGRIATYNKQNGSYLYELTDHLGNVRVVIGQNKTSTGNADVVYYSDYYPFGSEMTLANSDYRYGYQGQYAEKDEESGWMNFMLRMYDPVIGRWMAPDPYGQHASPYLSMGNDPVSYIDPDGGVDGKPGFFRRLWNGIVGTTGFESGRGSKDNPIALNEVVIKGIRTYPSQQATISAYQPNLVDRWGDSQHWAAKISYKFVDDFFVGFQATPFGAPFYSKSNRRHLNGSFANQNEVNDAFVKTLVSVTPFAEVKLIPKINAAQFSSLTKGTVLPTLAPATRGTIIKGVNYVTNTITAKMVVKQVRSKGTSVNEALNSQN